jgi:hypothetical protein
MAALNVRLPKSLHARIRRLAKKEGISLNQFIVLAAAEKALLLETGHIGLDYIAARAARAEAAESDPHAVFLDYVDQAPLVDPDPEDQLE